MSILSALLRWNLLACEFLERRLSYARLDLNVLYDKSVVTAVRSTAATLVVDAGGGQRCGFAGDLRRIDHQMRLIAVDISPIELGKNSDADETRVADLNHRLPFADGEVGVVTSSHLIEHLTDPESFIRDTYRVLKPGGLCVHIFHCRFSPFALIKQALPQAWSVALVKRFFHGQFSMFCWAPVYYRRCYISSMHQLLERQGFECLSERASYYQAGYFKAIAPLFLLMVLYEMVIYRLRLNNLGSYCLVVARKRTDA